jgi:hypothetical protein
MLYCFSNAGIQPFRYLNYILREIKYVSGIWQIKQLDFNTKLY